MTAAAGTLVIGFGNPARYDDALGCAFGEAVERLGRADVTVRTAYQLALEDAVDIAHHEVVVFADAARSGSAPFAVHAVRPRWHPSFTSHALAPEDLLAVSQQLFGAAPTAYMYAIRGYRFDGIGEGLSPQARRNLESAISFFARQLTAQASAVPG